ncbi:MAG TPA: FAD-dependent oxidoreductase [Terracidiphilus sp.]|nr:FAD-dependent oxidoreductase [Terracidiphilus sp.]
MKGVFVIGAGPAGIFAAKKIALAGYDVFLFNRDIKPGGLAEYGIYPVKDKMKFGLRKQFAQVLALPNVHYFGHVQVGRDYDLGLDALSAFRPAAVVFACGAQGTRRLGLPGEDAKGVYAAKDFVYQYNRLPPYASMDFSTGKRIAVIGMGNVAIDIARWLLEDDPSRTTEQVLIVARRGPLEIKFDEKEIGYVDRHISREDLAAELERVRERCERCKQDVSPQTIFAGHFKHLVEEDFTTIDPRLCFRFLSSPTAILPDENGRIAKLEVAENDLVLKPDGNTSSVKTSARTLLDVDTLIFAIGDEHDKGIGLPMGPAGYATQTDAEHPDQPQYAVFDPQAGRVLPGSYVVGWARRASTGLVGVARHDGEVGAAETLEYLKFAPDSVTLSEREILARLRAKGLRPVTKSDLALLAEVEKRVASERQLTSFKFSDNDSMYKAIRDEGEQVPAQQGAEYKSVPAS